MDEVVTPCFHCGEPCADARAFRVEKDGASLPVCCGGCKAVAELIIGSGMDRYYRFREGTAPKALEDLDALESAWRGCDQRERMWGAELPDGQRELLLLTEGVHCAACAWLIRSRLEPLGGVERVSVDVATGYTRIVWNPSRQRLSRLALELARCGYRPHLPLAGVEEQARLAERRQALRRLGVAGLGMMQVMMYAVGLYAGEAFGISRGARGFLEWTSLLVTLPVVVYSGRPFFTSAIDSLRVRRPGMDVPVALAIGIAFVASCVNFLRGSGPVYFDTVVMFVFFLSVARYVQMAGRHRNLEAGSALARLLPEWADRLVAAGSERVPAEELEEGDRVRVRAGEAFPADGCIETGSTQVDESLLSGESHPRDRIPGDRVVGGSINIGQAVTFRVTAVGENSTLSALGRMLLRARAEGSRLASMADRLAGYFVVAVLGIATLTVVFWWRESPGFALQAMLAVLVVSCPCALSLATPAALASAGRALLRRGILLTRGDALEAAALADTVVFDKTGTLTVGQPEIAELEINPGRPDHGPEVVRLVAASLEAYSSHPLARAFVIDEPLLEVRDPRQYRQQGVAGQVAGIAYRLGTARFAQVPEVVAGADNGDLWLADGQGWLARFEVRDRLREHARETVEALQKEGLSALILSGDGAGAVERAANRLGIDDWQARQSPEAKIDRVRRLQSDGRRVMVIGDGVNDAPVLAAADVSMTVQGATELANSAADLVLNGQSLGLVIQARATALRARRVIRQNLAWALAYNLLAVPLAAGGWLQPWMAALGMSASSLLVVANSSRLLKT